MRTFVKLLLASGALLLISALWLRHNLPEPGLLVTELLEEPEQVKVRETPFESSVGGVTYRIEPLFSYELQGLVVSKHDSDTWWDYLHHEWNDHLNVVDLCVIWGNNAKSGAYRDIEFSSGQFTCNFQASSAAAFAAFDMTAISNNHLLTDDPLIAKKMRSVRIGDQVRFRGWLAEYSHNHNGQGFRRGTSTVRNDTGNGACETIYVKDFEIIRRGGGPWRSMIWVAWALIGIGLVGWFRLPLNHD